MNKFVSAGFIMAAASAIPLAISAGSAAAQTRAPSPYTDTSSLTDISAYLLSPSAQAPTVQGSNSATIIQNGSNNSATSDATVPSSVPLGTGSYFGNVTLQVQLGTNNVSNVQAVGNSNTLATVQAGDNNNTAITAYGSGNTFVSTQDGNNLSYTLQRVGNGQSISVSQKN